MFESIAPAPIWEMSLPTLTIYANAWGIDLTTIHQECFYRFDAEHIENKPTTFKSMAIFDMMKVRVLEEVDSVMIHNLGL